MIELGDWNESLQIGLTDWKTVYQFPQKELVEIEIHQVISITETKEATKE